MANGNGTPKFILFMREFDSTMMMFGAFALSGFVLYLFRDAIIKDGASGIIGIAGTLVGYVGHMIQSAYQQKSDNMRSENNGKNSNGGNNEPAKKKEEEYL